MADLRRLRGFSQRELASGMKRSESWVSHVERDVQPIERLSVLQALARALGVSVRTCAPTLSPNRATRAPSPTTSTACASISRCTPHLACSSPQPKRRSPSTNDELHEAVDNVWALAHESQYVALSDALTELLPRLEHGVREDHGDERKRVHALRPVPTRPRRRLSPGRTRPTPPGLQPIEPSVPLSCLEARSRRSPAISGWPTRSFGSGDSTRRSMSPPALLTCSNAWPRLRSRPLRRPPSTGRCTSCRRHQRSRERPLTSTPAPGRGQANR
jgi:transcriptional regulator with XRE-family HTH domain